MTLNRFDHWEEFDLKTALESPDIRDEDFYVVDGLVGKKSGTLVAGHPHAMKSLAALYGSMEAVIRGTWWGLQTRGIKRVTFLECEDSRLLVQKRIKEFGIGGFGLKPGELKDVLRGHLNVLVTGRFNIAGENDYQELMRRLERTKPDLVVLSTLQGMLVADWKEQRDMGPTLVNLQQIWTKVAPTYLITHSPQDKSLKRAAGSVTIPANFAVTGHMEKRGNRVEVNLDSKLGSELKLELTLETNGKKVYDFHASEVVGEHASEARPSKKEQDESLKFLEMTVALDRNPNIGERHLAEELGISRYQLRELKKKMGDQNGNGSINGREIA